MSHAWRNLLPVVITCLVGLSLSLWAWNYAREAQQDAEQKRFAQNVNGINQAIAARFAAYQQVLRGGVGLFEASLHVTRDEWQRYVEQLQVDQHYPGLQGIGFAQKLELSQVAEHIAAVRAEGFPNYTLNPTPASAELSAIIYLEPFDQRNQRAFGYDMYSNSVRREAMARARDSGQAALSGRVTLVQELDTDRQAGTLLYLPVYRPNMPLNSIADRRKALHGWVYSPMRMGDLMHGILGSQLTGLSLRIFDGDAANQDAVLYASHKPSASKAPQGPDFKAQSALSLAGREWSISVQGQLGYGAAQFSNPGWILLVGALLSLLLGLLVHSLRHAERRAAELADEMSQAFRSSEKRQRAVLENTADGILTIDEQGIVRSFNKAAESMFGYYAHEVIGNNVAMLMPARYRAHHDDNVASMESSAAHRQLGVRREVVGRRRDGEEFPVWLAVNKIPATGRPEYVGSVSDLTERKKILAELQHLAHHDALTNLPNRSLLTDRMQQAIHQAHRNSTKVALLMLDLDHFKRINDSLGHQIGDNLLRQVGKRLEESVREVDTVARMGGDEFVVFLPQVASRQAVSQVAAKVLSRLSEVMPIAGHEMIVTPSIGISVFPDDGDDGPALLKNADTAMYRAKASGRGNYKFFDKQMLKFNEHRLELESALRRALERKEFSLAYQPQIDIESGQLLGCEALLRWDHPQLGRVPPASFVPLAEEMGLIQTIGEWVLRTACFEVRKMQKLLNRPLVVAVNISPRQFFQSDIIAVIRSALKDSGLSPQSLEVEITEGVLLENSEATITLLNQIRAMGVAVAIDDFGTGYSSLSYLTRFPIDKLKIDQSFVRDITLDASDAAVTSAIIVMAHTLQLSVVAEGVETMEQLDFLNQRHCDVAQGFYFGRPVSREEFIASVDRFSRHLLAAPVADQFDAVLH